TGAETTLLVDTPVHNSVVPAVRQPTGVLATKPSVQARAPAAAPSTTAPTTTPNVPHESASVRAGTGSTATPSVTTPPVEAPPAAPAPPVPSALALALARLPFQNNERLEYQVKYGFLGVGSAVLE